MHTPLGVVGSESIQLLLQVETVPEEGLVEIFSPESSGESLNERMRARHERNRLDFLDVENAQIRSPTMKAEQRVVIGTEALGKRLPASRLTTGSDDPDRCYDQMSYQEKQIPLLQTMTEVGGLRRTLNLTPIEALL